METVGFFQVKHADGSVENSMGRLLAFMSTCAGIATVAAGIVLQRAEIVIAGAGMVGSGELLKYGQKIRETK